MSRRLNQKAPCDEEAFYKNVFRTERCIFIDLSKDTDNPDSYREGLRILYFIAQLRVFVFIGACCACWYKETLHSARKK